MKKLESLYESDEIITEDKSGRAIQLLKRQSKVLIYRLDQLNNAYLNKPYHVPVCATNPCTCKTRREVLECKCCGKCLMIDFGSKAKTITFKFNKAS